MNAVLFYRPHYSESILESITGLNFRFDKTKFSSAKHKLRNNSIDLAVDQILKESTHLHWDLFGCRDEYHIKGCYLSPIYDFRLEFFFH